MKGKTVKFLVRKLMITEDKGKDDCLPLIFVTGERELQLYKIVDSENFKIIKILY